MLKLLLILNTFTAIYLSGEQFKPTAEKPFRCGNEFNLHFSTSKWKIFNNSYNHVTSTGGHRIYSLSKTDFTHQTFTLDYWQGISWKDQFDEKDNGCYLLAIQKARQFERRFINRSPENCPIMKDNLGVYIENRSKNFRVYAVPSWDDTSTYFFYIYAGSFGFEDIISKIGHNNLRRD